MELVQVKLLKILPLFNHITTNLCFDAVDSFIKVTLRFVQEIR